MLISFSVENFLQYKNKMTMDLTHPGQYPLYNQCIEKGVIQKAIVYDNIVASYSNFGYALFDLVSHLTNFKRPIFSPLLIQEQISSFEYTFLFDGIEVKYSYKKQNGNLLGEILVFDDLEIVQWEKDGPVKCVYDISFDDFSVQTSYSLVSVLSKYKCREKNLIANIYDKFIDFVQGMLYINLTSVGIHIGYKKDYEDAIEYICNNDKLEQLQNCYDSLDIFCRLKIVEDRGVKIIYDKVTGCDFTQTCSSGTLRVLYLFYWLQKISEGEGCSFFYIEDFDRFFHIAIGKYLYEIIRELHGQVICGATFNTSLISYSVLRPDCYFCINNDCMQTLEQAADRKLRLSHNIEAIFRNKFRNPGNLS